MTIKLTKEDKDNLFKLLDSIQNIENAVIFIDDVDWKSCPELRLYPKIIKKPMCLRKIRNKVKYSMYKSPNDCFKDIQLIWDNCKTFNKESSEIYKIAEIFESKSKDLVYQFQNGDLQNETLTEHSIKLNEEKNLKHQTKEVMNLEENLPIINTTEMKFLQSKLKSLKNSDMINLLFYLKNNYPQSLISISKKKILLKVCRFNKSVYKILIRYIFPKIQENR